MTNHPDAEPSFPSSISGNAPVGVQGLLKSDRVSQETDHDSAVKQMFSDPVPVMKSEDAEQGVPPFMERRKAIYRGKQAVSTPSPRRSLP